MHWEDVTQRPYLGDKELDGYASTLPSTIIGDIADDRDRLDAMCQEAGITDGDLIEVLRVAYLGSWAEDALAADTFSNVWNTAYEEQRRRDAAASLRSGVGDVNTDRQERPEAP